MIIINNRYSELIDNIKYLVKTSVHSNVQIVCAAICGSRLKGYAAPDSDYDIKVFIIRPKEDYLKIHRSKDCIESIGHSIKIDDQIINFDLTIWDITKVLSLYDKSNCTVMEVFGAAANMRTVLVRDTDILDNYLYNWRENRNRGALAHHYLGNLSQMFGRRGGHRVQEALNDYNNAKPLLQMAHMAMCLEAVFDSSIPIFTVPSARTIQELSQIDIEYLESDFKMLAAEIAKQRATGIEYVNSDDAKYMINAMKLIYDDATEYIDTFVERYYDKYSISWKEEWFQHILKTKNLY